MPVTYNVLPVQPVAGGLPDTAQAAYPGSVVPKGLTSVKVCEGLHDSSSPSKLC